MRQTLSIKLDHSQGVTPRKVMWESILNAYISKGAKRGYWRLVVAGLPTEASV